jgi:hypothetical protein
MGIQISDDKAAQHICNLLITPTQVTINRVTGWGPTTRNAALDHQALAIERDHWYTVLIELCGNDYLAQIDDSCVLYGHAEGLDVAKPRLSLISSGNVAWYDHVKVWDATPDPLWPTRKEEVLKLKAKHQ